ncbi:unnamed protein product, partial [Ectocarpus sp. 6 AP-2014]
GEGAGSPGGGGDAWDRCVLRDAVGVFPGSRRSSSAREERGASLSLMPERSPNGGGGGGGQRQKLLPGE